MEDELYHTTRMDKNKSILLAVFFLLSFISVYFPIFNEYICWYLAFAISFAGIIFFGIKITKKEFILYSTIIVLFFLSIVVNNNVSFSSVIQYLRYIFITVILGRTKLEKKIFGFLYYCFCGYFLICLLAGVDPTDLVHGVSRNIISIHLLSLLILYIISLKNTKKMYKGFIATFIGLIITFWTGCRSGVLSFLIIMCGLLFTNAGINNKIKYMLIIVAIVMIGGLWSTTDGANIRIQQFLYQITGKESIKNNPRWVFLNEYISNIKNSPIDILFGGKLKEVSSIVNIDNNLHNSYFAGHAKMGLIFILIIILALFKSLFYYFKENKLFLFLLLAISVRAFTDTVAFNGLYDIFFYYFLFEYTWVYAHITKNSC